MLVSPYRLLAPTQNPPKRTNLSELFLFLLGPDLMSVIGEAFGKVDQLASDVHTVEVLGSWVVTLWTLVLLEVKEKGK